MLWVLDIHMLWSEQLTSTSPLEDTDSCSKLDKAVDVILSWARYGRAEGNTANKLMWEQKLFRLYDFT